MSDLISVIIPVYNVEQYLRQCLDSVINQTYRNLEIILIDDGSTDNSCKICDEYALKDSRIKVIHKQNGGVSSARNIGLDIAKGEYIGFVDSDDYIERDMYEVLYKILIQNHVKVSCCDIYRYNKDKFIETLNFPTEKILSFNDILDNDFHDLYDVDKLFDATVIGNIRFNEKIKMCEDVLFCYQILQKANNVAFCNGAKYYYRNNPKSVTKIHVFKKEYINAIKIYENLIDYCKEHNLKIGYKKYKCIQIGWIITFLSWIAIENPIKDKESLKVLLKYARKNLLHHLYRKASVKSKCFLFLSCINFNLLSLIYRLMLKLKVIK